MYEVPGLLASNLNCYCYFPQSLQTSWLKP